MADKFNNSSLKPVSFFDEQRKEHQYDLPDKYAISTEDIVESGNPRTFDPITIPEST